VLTYELSKPANFAAGNARTPTDAALHDHEHREQRPDANTYADRVQARVILIDGDTLAKLMGTHNIGVQIQNTSVIKRIDEDSIDSSDGNADGNLSAHQQSMTPVPGPRRLNQRPTQRRSRV
jgi:hypothetical protein